METILYQSKKIHERCDIEYDIYTLMVIVEWFVFSDDVFRYSFGKEVERMQFDLKNAWRISHANDDFK